MRRRVIGWGLFVALLAALTLFLGQVLPVQPRCTIGEDFHRISGSLSPDGSRLITRSRLPEKDEDDVWDTYTGKRLGGFQPMNGPAAESPGGRLIAGQAKNGHCLISDVQQVRQYPAGFGKIHSSTLSFSPLGKFLLVEEKPLPEREMPRIFVVEPETGKVLHTFPAKKDAKKLGFTPQENLIFWSPAKTLCEIRRLPQLELVSRRTLSEPLLFSPDNRLLVARDGKVEKPAPWLVWDLAADTIRPLLDEQGKPFREDLSEGKERQEPRGRGRPRRYRPITHFFSPNHEYLALVAKSECEIRLWETKTGKLHLKVGFRADGLGQQSFCHGSFSDDGKRLVLQTDPYPRLEMYDLESGEKLWEVKGNLSTKQSLTLIPATFLPSSSHDLEIMVEMELKSASILEKFWLNGDTGKPITSPPQKKVAVLGKPLLRPDRGLAETKLVVGEYGLVQEPAGKSPFAAWLDQLFSPDAPPSTRVQVFHLPSNQRICQLYVPDFERILLSNDGRTMVTIDTRKGDFYHIWSLPPKPALAQFAIPIGIGIGVLLLRWAWRRWAQKQSVGVETPETP